MQSRGRVRMRILLAYGQHTIIIIGTGHVFSASIREVEGTIAGVAPAAVCVELDPERYQALLSGERATFWDLFRARGLGFALFSSIMSGIQGQIGQDFGVMPGSDMLAAVTAAEQARSPVFFVDRNVGVTIARLVQGMPKREMAKMLGGALLSLLPFKKTVSEAEFDERFVSSILKEFKAYSPTAYRVLIEERNAHMGRAIVGVASRFSEPVTLVVVVGAGHLPGLHEWLTCHAPVEPGAELHPSS